MSKECGEWDIELSDVLYVPKLQDDVSSEGQLDACGMEIIKKNGEVIIRDERTLLFKGYRVGYLYYTSVGGTTMEALQNEERLHDTQTALWVTREIWHNRLGHLHEETMKKIPLKISPAWEKALADCETCFKGKMKRLPFPKNDHQKAGETLARIHQ